MSDAEIQSLAVNFSIVKHNEYKSLNKFGDVAAEELELPLLEDTSKTQEW